VADLSFCDIPIIIRDDMPVGCMVVVTENGKQVIPIVNLDIEVCSTLTERVDDNGPVSIEYGSRTVSGEVTAYFEDKELYARFVSGMNNVSRYAMEAIVKLGDRLARNGGLNRSGRIKWRKDRKRLAASVRRSDARAWREANGLASF
jgi:hypothetical protein